MADVTPREREIGTLIATDGRSNRDIAGELGIAESTVDSIRRSLYIKLGVSNAVQLTHHAIRAGWVRVKGMPGRPRKIE
jgi:two-component system, NarL family, nitrate/nitrite response regulator NarL